MANYQEKNNRLSRYQVYIVDTEIKKNEPLGVRTLKNPDLVISTLAESIMDAREKTSRKYPEPRYLIGEISLH